MPRLPVPLLGFPNERLYGENLLEIKHGPRTFFVEPDYVRRTGVDRYALFIQPEKKTFFYDNLLMVYTHINNAIEEMKDAEHRQADAGSGENVERHA